MIVHTVCLKCRKTVSLLYDDANNLIHAEFCECAPPRGGNPIASVFWLLVICAVIVALVYAARDAIDRWPAQKATIHQDANNGWRWPAKGGK